MMTTMYNNRSISYKEICLEIQRFFESHRDVGQFINSQTWDAQTIPQTYSIVILVPKSSSVYDNKLTYSFEIILADQLTESRNNTLDVYNDEHNIGLDFVKHFCDEFEDDYYINLNNVQFIPFEEKFDEILAGWILNVDVEVQFYKCDEPILEF